MSNNIKSSLPIIGNTLNCESRRKPSRKRHRNKSRNYNIRKKRLKKLHGKKKSSINKFNSSEFGFLPTNNQMMSNWYWSNYRKAVEWQEKHRYAYWKACALALFEENRSLLQIINQLHPAMCPKTSVTQNLLCKGIGSGKERTKQSTDNANIYEYVNTNDNDFENRSDDDDDDEEEETNDIEFEMSEEMMEFFEQSYKHKMELKELKAKELLHNAEEEIKKMQTNKLKRSTEMNLLYGDGASMIIGMETAVQLSFEKYCDAKSPKYWPNIPFRL